MPIIASDTGGGDFTPIPEGNQQGVCYGVVDLGTQAGGMFEPQRKVLILWELPFQRGKFKRDGEEADLPRAISEKYGLSLGSKANLRKMLVSWRGREFTEAELKAFDLEKVIGANCLLNIIHKPGKGTKANRVYANIAGVTSLPKGMKPVRPENPPLKFSFDDHPKGAAVLPEHMPEWIVEMIHQSEEWVDAGTPPEEKRTATSAPTPDKMDEDVPF